MLGKQYLEPVVLCPGLCSVMTHSASLFPDGPCVVCVQPQWGSSGNHAAVKMPLDCAPVTQSSPHCDQAEKSRDTGEGQKKKKGKNLNAGRYGNERVS